MLCTVLGIAPNTMLAKVCSDKNKPNGQYRLPSTREAVMDFVQNLPVRKVRYTLLKLNHMHNERYAQLVNMYSRMFECNPAFLYY